MNLFQILAAFCVPVYLKDSSKRCRLCKYVSIKVESSVEVESYYALFSIVTLFCVELYLHLYIRLKTVMYSISFQML